MQVTMNGRVAVITGASKGIGRAIAARMAECGADVALLARGPETLEEARIHVAEKAKGRVHVFPCDVSRAEDIAKTYADVMNVFGRVDILVNNAGTSQTGPFASVTDEIWQADLDLKLFAAIRMARLVWPQMVERRWGRIINVLNIGAKAPKPASAPTSVSRAAGMALTKVLAGEGAPHNVLVNSLHVGLIESDQWVRKHANTNSGSYDDFLAKMAEGVPLGRVGKAEEFANVACFLASDLASYVSGTSINVDGNMSPVM
ncbi:SDR family oxidoreductase [Bordetella sp. N]|uniref:SDR family oxidoreductase n=1 Tax=Bordetella sp. N TaxID=1746199 RepID=UPI00070CBCD6|nr:SDR family oxidoreductase [Bordetella sp. N]ALM85817.1 short-chain dehydrogenase [Bordetella sp. N]